VTFSFDKQNHVPPIPIAGSQNDEPKALPKVIPISAPNRDAPIPTAFFQKGSWPDVATFSASAGIETETGAEVV